MNRDNDYYLSGSVFYFHSKYTIVTNLDSLGQHCLHSDMDGYQNP